ncbi:hypothetical protein KBC03_03490 [Patescibacteria group bacterium]|nr:hypothetical protein [Patescibacteria group bacterium]
MTALQKQSEDDVKTAITEVQSKIDTAADTQSPDIQNMPGMADLLEKWNEGDGFLQNGNINIGFDSPELSKFTAEAEKAVDTVLKGMCQGFQLGKG